MKRNEAYGAARFSAGIPWRARNCAVRPRPTRTFFADGHGVLTSISITLSGLVALRPREIVMDPAQHDRLVAWSSHLPQLASTALASVIGERSQEAAAVAGPGLLDASTRLAMSSFDLWRDIWPRTTPEVCTPALDVHRKIEGAAWRYRRGVSTGQRVRATPAG